MSACQWFEMCSVVLTTRLLSAIECLQTIQLACLSVAEVLIGCSSRVWIMESARHRTHLLFSIFRHPPPFD